ncbi:MAG TPA: hypothetical protein VJU78_07375, partial [Chitinophagaceae bacterium]|nr:hypothetical protein [Chitinophagaceae bacterium]
MLQGSRQLVEPVIATVRRHCDAPPAEKQEAKTPGTFGTKTSIVMIINLSKQHSLISNWVSELRDVDIQT